MQGAQGMQGEENIYNLAKGCQPRNEFELKDRKAPQIMQPRVGKPGTPRMLMAQRGSVVNR